MRKGPSDPLDGPIRPYRPMRRCADDRVEQADDVQRFMNEVVVPATYRVTD
jgi:hypothetical protein